MRFILRKYVDAANAKEALRMDRKTPVHDVYLKDGEEPPKCVPKDLIGFVNDEPIGIYDGEAYGKKRR